MKKIYFLFAVLLPNCLWAQALVRARGTKNDFVLASAQAGSVAGICVDAGNETLVQKAAAFLQSDLESVTGVKPALLAAPGTAKELIIVGNIKTSTLLKNLIAEKKLRVDALRGKWEAYQWQVVRKPFKGVEQALIIAGSDRRGTAYGVFELSRQIGVSPWQWWADVPVKKNQSLFLPANTFLTDAPKIKYRGIFINDEAPALSNWSKLRFGGFNHQFYEKVFELMLRLKANYLWPAMWGNAFYDDDPLNLQTADDYGIVIGTSHHEPLMRAHDEWRRYGQGKWNYDSNEVRLKEFWRTGFQRAKNEKIVSIGMRGDGDEPMSRETATALLERIVQDQRKIIEEVSGKPASETPQLWALYKEVQDYYDKGMRVPDDVTLLLCDDNWGNIRRLPKIGEKPRKGGYGIYYHFDYVGGPRNYKWINTNNLARVWEQMHLAWEHQARQIWIVNVGDIKPMELPISFFLDYSWNPSAWSEKNIDQYYAAWAGEQFGSSNAERIGKLLRLYSQYAARRKPELLDEKTYSLDSYNEFKRVVDEWSELEADAGKISLELDPAYRDAFFQLVWHPIKAMTNLHEMYYAVAMNKRFSSLRYAIANDWANTAIRHYQADSLLTIQYHAIANGKWDHMMDQTHIGYTYWQQPPVNKMPAVKFISADSVLPEGEEDFAGPRRAIVPATAKGRVFYEENRVVSMQSEHWTKAVNGSNLYWRVIPGIGRDGSGISSFPVTSAAVLSAGSPRVEYEFYSYSSGKASAQLYFSPTLNFQNGDGLQFAVSIDDQAPVIISLNKEDNMPVWNSWVANNIIIKKLDLTMAQAGRHTLKYWLISPGIVLQKLAVDLGGGAGASYLGPVETLKK